MPKNKKKNVKHKKQVKLAHHHSKPFRKRHYGSFFALFIAAIVLLVLLVQYNDLVYNSTSEAKSFIGQLFNSNRTSTKNISSTYGFTFTYDSNKLYASAYDSSNGNLYIGDELSTSRQYQEVRLSSSWVNGKSSTSQMTIKVSPQSSENENLNQIEKKLMESGNYKGEIMPSSSTVEIGGNTFLKSVWHKSQSTQPLLSKVLNPVLTTYSGKVNGRAYQISISQATSNEDISSYLDVISSMILNKKVV